MDKHWEVKSFYKGNKYHVLFVDDKELLRFVRDIEFSNFFHYYSDFLNVEDDCIMADSIEEAKKEFEEIVIDYCNQKIWDYEDIIRVLNK